MVSLFNQYVYIPFSLLTDIGFCPVEQHFLHNHGYDTYLPYQFELFCASFQCKVVQNHTCTYITDLNLVIMSCAYKKKKVGDHEF